MSADYPYERKPHCNFLPLLIVLALLAAAIWYFTGPYSPYNPDSEPRPVTARGDLAGDETNSIDLFESVSPSVVYITSIELRRSMFSLNIYEIP